MGFEALGVLIAVIVQGIFVSNTRCKGDEVVNATSIEVQVMTYFITVSSFSLTEVSFTLTLSLLTIEYLNMWAQYQPRSNLVLRVRSESLLTSCLVY